MGTKGLPQNVNVTIDDFKACLEKGTSFFVDIQTLTRKNNEMSRVSVTKRGLSRIFTKFPVQDDGVTCDPLKINNEIL